MGKFWSYRAYDEKLKIVDGVAEAESFGHLALELRSSGLQVFSANTMDKNTYRMMLKYYKTTKPDEGLQTRPEPSISLIRRIILKLLDYLKL